MNQFGVPTTTLGMNAQRITNLGNATLSTDAMNQASGDARYYLNTETLSDILPPVVDVSLASNKIVNLANGTLLTDALNYG